MNYQEEIDSIYKNYNDLALGENLESARYKDFVPGVIEKKVQEWRKGKVDILKTRAVDLLNKIQSEFTVLQKKIPAIKYPLKFSPVTMEKVLYESQRSNAFSFVKTATDLKIIKEEIEAAFNLGEVDYGNNLIDAIQSSRPSQVELSNAPKDKQDFYHFIDSVQQQFNKDNNISDMDENIKELKLSKHELEYFLDRIELGEKFIITLRQAKKHSSRDLEKMDLNAVNRSMSYFSKI